jgi:hypothetical protein
MPVEPKRGSPTCTRCGASLECCAFCERDNCDKTICLRCLRTELRQSLVHPHLHGG